jgi:hypothetical protein
MTSWNRQIAFVVIVLAIVYFILRLILYSPLGAPADIALAIIASVGALFALWYRYNRRTY